MIAPKKLVGTLRNELQGILLHRPKVKCIYPCPEDPDNKRILVLDPKPQHQQSDDNDNNIDAIQAKLDNLIAANHPEIQRTTYTLSLSYKDYSMDELFKRILPASIGEIPSSFEQVGPICHVNLRDELLPYKYWIGKVLLDKNQPAIRTVVNKLGNIDTEFRTFGMEVLAGNKNENWSIVTVKEEGCSFQLDFQQVYWNSRLAGEHKRMVTYLREKAIGRKLVVADLMAGVGPFAIPLTACTMIHSNNKRGGNINNKSGTNTTMHVYANDLNPASFQYLEINARENKCENLYCFNLDARKMVHQLQDDKIVVDHFLMNLPKTAPEFLDAFRGYKILQGSDGVWPTIHVYCFVPKSSEANDYPDALERCNQALGCEIVTVINVKTVRDIAPTKNMICISFVLPETVAQLPRIEIDRPDDHVVLAEPDSKRFKLQDDNRA
jgi:tRNA (guanine37-N1)-methyltransferase